MDETRYRVVCNRCGEEQLLGPAEMLAHVQSQGMLRRDNKPDPQLLIELFESRKYALACRSCNDPDIQISEFQDEWDLETRCAVCGGRIDPERLEAIPNVTHCSACQSKEERGETGEREFCERCGEVLQIRSSQSGGMTRYAQFCPGCGR